MLIIEYSERNMRITIKIVLAVLLLISWAKGLPYGYFQFLRLVGFIGLGYLAIKEFQNNRNFIGLIALIPCILLNPIFKIHFIRYTWNVIDTIIAGLLLIWVLSDFLILRHSKVGKEI